MTDPTLIDRICLAREGAAVERCHAHPHLQRYSVGHHSLDLVTLVILCWQEDHHGGLPSARLIAAAAFHDIPERITGDIPSTMKDEKAEAADEKVLAWLGVDFHLDPEERLYLERGDQMELWLWTREELMRGNLGFASWEAYFHNKFSSAPMPPSYSKVFNALRVKMAERLDEGMLLEIIK